jgi:hypothetical protein
VGTWASRCSYSRPLRVRPGFGLNTRAKWVPALRVHDEVLGDAVRHARGTVFKHTGDGVYAVFDSVSDALGAAAAAQRALSATDWRKSADCASAWRCMLGRRGGAGMIGSGQR